MIDWTKKLRFKKPCPAYGGFVYQDVTEVSGVIQYRDRHCRMVTYIDRARNDEEVTIVSDETGCEVVGNKRGYVFNLKKSFSPILRDNFAKDVHTSVARFVTELDAFNAVDKDRYDVLGYIERSTGEITWR